MGCVASQPAAKPADSEEERQETKGSATGSIVDAKDVNIGGLSTDRSGGLRTDRSGSVVNEEFVAWSEMEAAEEQDYLVDEEKDSRLFERLPSFSEKYGKRERSYNDPTFWKRILTLIEPEPDGFQLTAPFTLRKAHQLYRYLRTGAAKPLPRKAVYEVLIAACKQLEAQSKEQGALQLVPPPAKGEHLYVCGDTHGQLQDVLWIFELHGEPAPGNAYLFNGDMADRGANAVEIFVLLLAYKLASPGTVYMNRGNHEQRDLNERPFASGGGFAWEVRRKYPHDENLIELFQRLFMLLPIASVVGSWAFVIHGGLFRNTDVTFDDLRKVNNKRQPPIKLDTRDDELLFDALWSDPHEGEGVATGSARGGFSIQFGHDVTRAFCKRTGVKSVIRSHQLPKKQRGFEIAHNSMLLTIFSASNYGGVCRNRGGVLIIDERGPAEVKEFYAPPLAELRQMSDEKLMGSIRERVRRWSLDAAMGPAHRDSRKRRRKRSVVAEHLWTHLLFDTDAEGRLAPRDRQLLAEQTRAWEEQQRRAAEAEGGGEASEARSVGRSSSWRRSSSGAGGWSLSRRMSDGLLASGKEGAIERHSLVCAPLRSDRGPGASEPAEIESAAGSRAGDRDRALAAGRASSAGHGVGRDGGIEVGAVATYQVTYLVEPEMKAECETEILTSLRMQVCRMRAELTSAFMLEHGLDPAPAPAPDLASDPASDEPPRVGKAKSVSHAALYMLPYDRWLKVLSAVLPEYSSILPAYAPRLLATSTGAEAEAEARGTPVNVMRWLDRFQVTIAYENYADFKHDILQRVLEQTKAKTRGMSTADVLSYFDPKNDGSLRITDVANVLRDLQLGLPERQLQQLVYELGFTDPSQEVEPVEVLTLILTGLSSFKRRVKRASLLGETAVRVGVQRASTARADTRPPSKAPPQPPPLPRSASSSDHTNLLEALHALLHANKSRVREALGGDSMVHLFSRADTNEDGHLSYAETKKVLVELVAVCGGSDEVAEAQLDDLISRIDNDGDGKVTFMEFVAAFGLAFCPRLDQDTDAQEISSHLADELMQQICSALYDRSHALQKAFIFLDEKGEGWLPLEDFESALLLVLSPGADGQPDAPRGEQRGEHAGQPKQEDQVLMAAQVKDLVASLKRSHMVNPLKDLQSPEIDYNMFIQSFTVIDTLLDQP